MISISQVYFPGHIKGGNKNNSMMCITIVEAILKKELLMSLNN